MSVRLGAPGMGDVDQRDQHRVPGLQGKGRQQRFGDEDVPVAHVAGGIGHVMQRQLPALHDGARQDRAERPGHRAQMSHGHAQRVHIFRYVALQQGVELSVDDAQARAAQHDKRGGRAHLPMQLGRTAHGGISAHSLDTRRLQGVTAV
jgi:hypothetical protein